MSKKPAPKLQYAALPYRRRADGIVEVMLVTSRDTGRWVIPKGWPHTAWDLPTRRQVRRWRRPV